MTTATKEAFKPTAVLITEAAEFQTDGRTAVDPKLVTPLHLDSYNNNGWLFTKEEWENDQEPRIYRRYRTHEGLREGERVELLPDMWIVKDDEREYWIDPTILERTKRIFGVYVFDRRRHVHLCSFDANYECTFLGSQWEPSRELSDEETEELDELIRAGDRDWQDIKYFGVAEIDRMIANPCKEGCFPTGKSGGFHLDVVSVVTDDAVAEIQEWNCQSEL